jgi:hypothetical protein
VAGAVNDVFVYSTLPRGILFEVASLTLPEKLILPSIVNIMSIA